LSDEPTIEPSPEVPQMVATEKESSRYEGLGLLGRGGMGEVRRVRDRSLNQVMAMTIISAKTANSTGAVPRFIEEAQATSHLQHPGIVPVHELGQLADGRPYFTLQEVRGQRMSDVIRAVHQVSKTSWATPATGWHFRPLVNTFQQVCTAEAYAHSKGVIRRDLKPGNIMLGAFGEALVVDWGLAKLLGQPGQSYDQEDRNTVMIDPSGDDTDATRMGTVSATPAYMPPEQARGHIDQINARSHIYSLRAILYEVLMGRPPYEGTDRRSVHTQVLLGPPPGLADMTAPNHQWAGHTWRTGQHLSSRDGSRTERPIRQHSRACRQHHEMARWRQEA
jgi:serine/threonine protein kinase